MKLHKLKRHIVTLCQPFKIRLSSKGVLVHCWWECKLVGEATVKTVWRFLKKLKIELPYDRAIPLLDIYPEKKKKQKH